MPPAQPTNPMFGPLATIYDLVMQDVEYDEWLEFMVEFLATQGWSGVLRPNTMRVLELGCGTGNFSHHLLQHGFLVVGLDASREMLAVAHHKLPQLPLIEADFRSFVTNSQFDLIVSVFDSLNNLLSISDLQKALHQAFVHLNDDGWLVFDLNTKLGVRELWDGGAWSKEFIRPDGIIACNWTHEYDVDQDLGIIHARFSLPDGQTFYERHMERGYEPEEVLAILESLGFWQSFCFEYPDFAPATANSQRLWFFAHKWQDDTVNEHGDEDAL
jgi:SAM-dependent methyltransferase